MAVARAVPVAVSGVICRVVIVVRRLSFDVRGPRSSFVDRRSLSSIVDRLLLYVVDVRLHRSSSSFSLLVSCQRMGSARKQGRDDRSTSGAAGRPPDAGTTAAAAVSEALSLPKTTIELVSEVVDIRQPKYTIQIPYTKVLNSSTEPARTTFSSPTANPSPPDPQCPTPLSAEAALA